MPIAAKLAPSALQWAQKRGSRETAFDFAAEVRDAKSNRVVGALRDTITVKIDAEHFQDIQQHALVYQGGIILAPGEYKLKFLARENESGRIGTFEQNISLAPPQLDRLQVSSLLLSSQVEAVQNAAQIKTQALAKDAKLKSSPLDVGGERIIPSVTRVFTGDQTLYVFFQAYAPQKADANSLRAGLVFFRNGQRLSDTPMVAPTEYDEKSRTASFRLSLPLSGLSAGRYTVQAIVVDAGTAYAAFARNYFALRPTPKPAASATIASSAEQLTAGFARQYPGIMFPWGASSGTRSARQRPAPPCNSASECCIPRDTHCRQTVSMYVPVRTDSGAYLRRPIGDRR